MQKALITGITGVSYISVAACSFATFPNAFKQCTISLLIIHSAIITGWVEKLPDPSTIYDLASHTEHITCEIYANASCTETSV
jgi:hypothetical protein